jgi:exopolysaccharide biosynthesis polyprenyl glycosylphosphotransferase
MAETARQRSDPPSFEIDGVVLRSDTLKRYRRLSASIAVTDGLSIVVAMITAFVFRFGFQPVPTDFALLIAAAPLALAAVFTGFGLYSIQLISPAEEFRRVIAAVGTTIAAMALFGFWSHVPYSRLWLGWTWVLTLVLCLISRRRWHRAIARRRVGGELAYRTLVVGDNQEAASALRAFDSPALGFRPIAIASTGSEGEKLRSPPAELIKVPPCEIENVDALRRVISEFAVDCVFVASSAVTPELVAVISKAARLEGVEVRLSMNLPHILLTRLTVQPLDHLTIISLKSAHLSGRQAVAKRTLDVLGGTIGLILTLPLCIGIAIAIRISSGSPVLFRQTRIGRQGRSFTMLKFRTMVPGAEEMLLQLKDLNEADGPVFKIRKDPRATSVGKWLRGWSLDELPQLINVLKGDMSLVGPRPPLEQEVACYEDWQCGRLEVAPGITGLWQVEGRVELPFEDAVRRDLFYIENWSLSYDLFIMAKTIPALLSRRGAY